MKPFFLFDGSMINLENISHIKKGPALNHVYFGNDTSMPICAEDYQKLMEMCGFVKPQIEIDEPNVKLLEEKPKKSKKKPKESY